jgi:hypothetical protein
MKDFLSLLFMLVISGIVVVWAGVDAVHGDYIKSFFDGVVGLAMSFLTWRALQLCYDVLVQRGREE